MEVLLMEESRELNKRKLVEQWLAQIGKWEESDQELVEIIVDLLCQAYQAGMSEKAKIL